MGFALAKRFSAASSLAAGNVLKQAGQTNPRRVAVEVAMPSLDVAFNEVT